MERNGAFKTQSLDRMWLSEVLWTVMAQTAVTKTLTY
jgi:hypothetical protein